MSPTKHILLISPEPLPLNGTLRATHATDVFAAIAMLARPGVPQFDAVVTRAVTIADRPAAALAALRQAAGGIRIMLLADPQHEPLARHLTAGQQPAATDYLIHPTTSDEITAVINTHTTPRAATKNAPESVAAAPAAKVATTTPPPAQADLFVDLSTALSHDLLLQALLDRPADAVTAALTALQPHLPAGHQLIYTPAGSPAPKIRPDQQLLATAIPPVGHTAVAVPTAGESPLLHLIQPAGADTTLGRDTLSQLAPRLSRLAALQERHTKLQRLAISDELTGLANGRYFHHFLARVLDRAKDSRTPVTVLLFDIDNFKKYNDQFGHAAGDEILQAVSQLMKRCVREHDLVARLGGDEFAVVFWDTGSRRTVHDLTAEQVARAGKPLADPVIVFNRFRRLLSRHEFRSLGSTGRGQLTISGGLAVYPYDATTPKGLLEAADKCLMFGSKRSGKNTLTIVGDEAR
jgi:GGDEF domain-containing protein